MVENLQPQIEQDDEIDLLELFSILKAHIVLIIVVTVIAAVAGFMVTEYAITPQYEASVNMIVNTRTDVTATVSNDSINSAKSLVSTYAIIIKSNTVLNQVIANLKLQDMNYDTLAAKVSVEAIDDTQVMKVAVKDPDPELARKIVKEIAKISPEEIVDSVEAGSCKVVSQVRVPADPVSPSLKKNVVIAAAAGFVLVVAIVLLKNFLANYIVDDDDIQKYLGLPVLGVIPEIEEGK